jgi:hypothetical protein
VNLPDRPRFLPALRSGNSAGAGLVPAPFLMPRSPQKGTPL